MLFFMLQKQLNNKIIFISKTFSFKKRSKFCQILSLAKHSKIVTFRVSRRYEICIYCTVQMEYLVSHLYLYICRYFYPQSVASMQMCESFVRVVTIYFRIQFS